MVIRMTNHNNLVLSGIYPSEQKGRNKLAENVISNIIQIDKESLMKKLAIELPTLRAKLGSSQADLAELIGVSRQTYSMIENRKKEMGWSIYMSLILVFSSNPKTAALLEFSGAYPDQLRSVLQQDEFQEIK